MLLEASVFPFSFPSSFSAVSSLYLSHGFLVSLDNERSVFCTNSDSRCEPQARETTPMGDEPRAVEGGKGRYFLKCRRASGVTILFTCIWEFMFSCQFFGFRKENVYMLKLMFCIMPVICIGLTEDVSSVPAQAFVCILCNISPTSFYDIKWCIFLQSTIWYHLPFQLHLSELFWFHFFSNMCI